MGNRRNKDVSGSTWKKIVFNTRSRLSAAVILCEKKKIFIDKKRFIYPILKMKGPLV